MGPIVNPRNDANYHQCRQQAERQQYLGVTPYERSEGHRDQANGCKPKTVLTRIGGITIRKMAAITEQLCGRSVSSSQVSQATQQLD